MDERNGMTAAEAEQLARWTPHALRVIIGGTKEQAAETLGYVVDRNPRLARHAAIQWTFGVLIEQRGAIGGRIRIGLNWPDATEDQRDVVLTLFHAVNNADWIGAHLLLDTVDRDGLVALLYFIGKFSSTYLGG